jgi:HAMP domain-containing protein/type II secretory pathway pseudopilin PulG
VSGPAAPARPGERRSRRWSSIPSRLAVLIVVLLLVSAVATAVYAGLEVRREQRANAAESTENALRTVNLAVDQATRDIADYEARTLAARKALLRDLTDAQLEALEQLQAAVVRGELTEAEAQRIGGQMLFDYRYGNGDYFFAFTPEMVSIVEPNPVFRGDMLDYRDPNGKAFFREFQAVALGPGAGYVDYVGTRVGATEPAPKISYVALYAPWQWVVGTGVYLDDIAAEAAARQAKVEARLGRSLDRVEFLQEGFFFVLDRDGEIVAAPRGRGAETLVGTGAGRRLAATLVAAAPARGTELVAADARFGGEVRRWDFEVAPAAAGEWVLVAAVPEARVHELGDRLARNQILLGLVVLVLGVGVGVLVSRRIVRPVQDLTDAAVALEADAFAPERLDAAAARRDEVGTLARAFRRMAAEVVARERALRAQVARLQVVIDRDKVDREITEITDTDFFQGLERRAAALRERAASSAASHGASSAASSGASSAAGAAGADAAKPAGTGADVTDAAADAEPSG